MAGEKNSATALQWYESLVEDCKAIITEAVFTSRWALVEGYWNLGKRIQEDKEFQKFAKGNQSSLQDLANNLNTSERTIYYARQAFNKFPDIGKLPEGKNLTWNKLITQYLPEPKQKIVSLPEGDFNVIYADPPWSYNDVQDTKMLGGAKKHYQTMSIEKLCKLQLPLADNAVLFLWVTSPLLEECFAVINAWGFKYKTSFIWDKVKHNMGHYNSVRHEFLLVCTKGSFTPEVKKLYDSVIQEERSDEHSEKPKIVYEIIETLYPNGKYLELFARNKRRDWDSWGDQV